MEEGLHLRGARFADRAQLQLQHVGVRLHGGGLVEVVKAEVVGLAVGPRHLDEGVDVADGGDVVGDEGAHLRLELDVVRLVPGHGGGDGGGEGGGGEGGSEGSDSVSVGIRARVKVRARPRVRLRVRSRVRLRLD